MFWPQARKRLRLDICEELRHCIPDFSQWFNEWHSAQRNQIQKFTWNILTYEKADRHSLWGFHKTLFPSTCEPQNSPNILENAICCTNCTLNPHSLFKRKLNTRVNQSQKQLTSPTWRSRQRSRHSSAKVIKYFEALMVACARRVPSTKSARTKTSNGGERSKAFLIGCLSTSLPMSTTSYWTLLKKMSA